MLYSYITIRTIGGIFDCNLDLGSVFVVPSKDVSLSNYWPILVPLKREIKSVLYVRSRKNFIQIHRTVNNSKVT